MARKGSSSEAVTRLSVLRGTPLAGAVVRRTLAPLERSLQAGARKTARERRAAQSKIDALQAPLVRLVGEQPNYERLARRQRVPMAKPPRYYRHSTASRIDALGVFSAVPPYSFDWTWHLEDPGSHGVPSVNKSTGQFGGHADNVANCSAGVGVLYRPQAADVLVQCGSVIKYGIYYVANSHFMTAHTEASLNVLVTSTDLAGGDAQTIVDSRTPIFNVTTPSGQLTYQSANTDNLEFRPSVQFRAQNQRNYLVWTWCEIHTWGNDGANPNWSQAYGNLWATALNIAIWY
jgi:hypothetical protein